MPSMAERIRCPRCGGTSWMMCSGCRGSGKESGASHKPAEKDETQWCSPCGGRGMIKCNNPECQGGWLLIAH
jgi:DnaJ-class molecular chaperone